MKKILTTAIALPLILAACSAEEDLLNVNNGNDLYPEVAKVDATFGMEEMGSRLATQWGLENGDQLGLAWLGDEANVGINGMAYQNHPLFANANGTLVPQTSIYVGQYFSYFPYDIKTQTVGEINFSVEEQDLLSDYQGLAKKSIWISPRLTKVTAIGDDINGDGIYGDANKAGVGEVFNVYPRQFTNIVGLVLDYVNNAPSTGTPEIKSIKVSYLNGATPASVMSFTYAPKADVIDDWGTNNAKCTEDFWSDYNLTPAAGTGAGIYSSRAAVSAALKGVIPTTGAITLTPSSDYYAEGDGASFMYNALPANAEITADTKVKFVIETTYGVITFEKAIKDVAYTNIAALGEKAEYKAYPDGRTLDWDNTTALATTKQGVDPDDSFVARLYKTGKIVTDVDFYTAIMNNMHVADDAELQKVLNYYLAYKLPSYKSATKNYSEKDTNIKLYLDGTNGYFELSKTSVALVQKINALAKSNTYKHGSQLISLEACSHNGITDARHALYNKTTRVALTEGQEIPNLDNVFADATTTVYLSENDSWTWNANEGVDSNADRVNDKFGKFFGNVTEIVNEGDLTIGIDHVSALAGLANVTTTAIKNEGELTITDEVRFNLNLTNFGEVTVYNNAAIFAEGAEIINDAVIDSNVATTHYASQGKIENYGEIGVVSGTSGVITNYGYIKNNEGAKTYITNNQTAGASFSKNASDSNKMGTIEVSTATDNVSVKNSHVDGFIKFVWDGGSVYKTPAKDVRYNYLIVRSDIKFTEAEAEVLYIEVAGANEVVITAPNKDNLDADAKEALFTTSTNRLKGFIVKSGCKANIKEGNQIYSNAAHIAGRLYLGGYFVWGGKQNSFYGNWNKSNIIEQ